MGKYRHLIFIILIWALPGISRGADPESLDLLLTKYQAAMDKSESAAEKQRAVLNRKYSAALAQLKTSLRAKGNLDELLVLQQEADRFDGNPVLRSEHITTGSKALESLQKKVLRSYGSLEAAASKNKFKLMSSMVRQLEALQVTYVKDGLIDAAVKTRQQIETIKSFPSYAAEQEKMAEAAARRAQSASKIRHRRTAPAPLPSLGKPMLEVELVKMSLSKLAKNNDYDDKVQNIQFKVKVKSREMVKNYENLTIRVWGVGKDVNSKSNFKVLLQESLTIESLQRGQQAELLTKRVKNIYDNHASAQYGYKYAGYVLEIEDEEGKVLYAKSSPSKFKRNVEKIKLLQEGGQFSL